MFVSYLTMLTYSKMRQILEVYSLLKWILELMTSNLKETVNLDKYKTDIIDSIFNISTSQNELCKTIPNGRHNVVFVILLVLHFGVII